MAQNINALSSHSMIKLNLSAMLLAEADFLWLIRFMRHLIPATIITFLPLKSDIIDGFIFSCFICIYSSFSIFGRNLKFDLPRAFAPWVLHNK